MAQIHVNGNKKRNTWSHHTASFTTRIVKQFFASLKGEQINETSKHQSVIRYDLSQSYPSCSVSGRQVNVTRSNIIQVDPSGVGLQPLACRDFDFESRQVMDVSLL